jgi:hypothetical protein
VLTEFVDERIAKDLLVTLGNLPLAIVQAGAYIRVHPGITLKKYCALYNKSAESLYAQRPPPAVWDYRNDTVFTTWEVSFDAIKEQDAQAAHLLLLCGFLAKDDIWEPLLRRGRNFPENGECTISTAFLHHSQE